MMQDRSIPELFSNLIENVTTLFRKEVQLAKTELSEKVSQVSTAGISLAIGGVVLLAALIFVLHAVVQWLAVAGVPLQWGFTIVGVVMLIIGYVFLQKGISNLKTSNLMPSKTMDQLQRDASVVKEQVG